MTSQQETDIIYHLAHWLRNRSSSTLPLKEYVSAELSRRVMVFHGDDLLEVMNSTNFLTIPQFKTIADYDEDQLKSTFQTMITRQYFLNVIPLDINRKRSEEQTTQRVKCSDKQEFHSDGMYMWQIDPDQTMAIVKAVGVVAAIFAVCCYRIWPLILRIGLYYLCVLLLSMLILLFLGV